jgi:hypothetical protein
MGVQAKRFEQTKKQRVVQVQSRMKDIDCCGREFARPKSFERFTKSLTLLLSTNNLIFPMAALRSAASSAGVIVEE